MNIKAPSALCILAATLFATLATARGQTASSGEDPQITLGKRVESLRQKQRARSTLLIAPDAATFAEAIAHWKIGLSFPLDCFPVLIDDGSDLARENIARFIRAYQPKAVLRLKPTKDAWPAPTDTDKRRQRIETALAQSWEAEDVAALKSKWSDAKFDPLGVVVASTTDPAWPGALALAAWHGQPIIWSDAPPRDTGETMSPTDLEALDRTINTSLETLAYPWKDLGDSIDSVTLCVNAPSKVKHRGGGGIESAMALTDRIGRDASGKRWAWAGQIMGDEATSAYRAMCSIFLIPTTAWAFEGYENGSVPGIYMLKPVIPMLATTNISIAFDPARNSLAAWRNAVRYGIDAGIVWVNTKGQMWNFELSPGKAWASDVPMLRQPAIVHFTHSFSAASVSQRWAIAGRWLENGAYAYIGSVDEPYLQAFLPPKLFFERFLIGGTLGSLVRWANAPVWKINVYADPLQVQGNQLVRIEDDLPLDGPVIDAVPLKDELNEHLKAGRFVEAASDLVLLGRDQDAVRLAQARPKSDDAELVKKAAAAAPSLARIAVPAAVRARDPQAIARLYPNLPDKLGDDPFYSSILWLALRAELASNDAPAEYVNVLRAHIRQLSAPEDALALASHVQRLYGRDAMESMFQQLIAKTTDGDQRTELERGLTQAKRN